MSRIVMNRHLETLCCLFVASVVACVPVPGLSVGEVSFGAITVSSNADALDMQDIVIEDWDAFCAFLSALPNLRTVNLFATKIDRTMVEELHSRFPLITFGMTMRMGNHIVRTDATAFSTLNTPASPRLEDDDVSVLRYCTGLYALDLGHNELTDLSFLYDLPELRVLIAAMNRLTDITPIGSLCHLEYLELFGNRITDISCLGQLPYLMDLNIANNTIEDGEPLLQLGGLRRLWMYNYGKQLTYGEVEREAEYIRCSLSDCQVNSTSPPIEGGWRGHPHYEVIRRIFQTSCYEPFNDSPLENLPER